MGIESGLLAMVLYPPMSKYTNGTEMVDAIMWTGDFTQIQAFLQQNPPVLDPKATEDKALGVEPWQDGTLLILVGPNQTYQTCRLTDMLIRGGDLKLRSSDSRTFEQTFTLVN